MNLFSRIINSLKFRIARRRLFVNRVDQPGKTALRIRNRNHTVTWPESEHTIHNHELYKIFLDDCYGLKHASLSSARQIVDVGSNVGLFSLAAARQFPSGTIHCYEPNRELNRHLTENLEPLGIRYFAEAVGIDSGRVALSFSENSLHTCATSDESGTIPMTAFKEVVSRIGRTIDILKLDCEGAEWEILKDRESMKHVKFLTMEYHLWARPNSKLSDFLSLCSEAGFTSMTVNPSKCGSFGMAHGWNQTALPG